MVPLLRGNPLLQYAPTFHGEETFLLRNMLEIKDINIIIIINNYLYTYIYLSIYLYIYI